MENETSSEIELDTLIPDEKQHQSASESREPQPHAAQSFKRKHDLADHRIRKYRKVRIHSPPDRLLTGEKIELDSRLLWDDALYAMKAFTRHAARCSTCAHPYYIRRKGRSLCSKGTQRALNVYQYILNSRGQFVSANDLESNQMEIPAFYNVARELLMAMERGLRVRRIIPITSYNKVHYIQPIIIKPTFKD